jgi:hypothetical protein
VNLGDLGASSASFGGQAQHQGHPRVGHQQCLAPSVVGRWPRRGDGLAHRGQLVAE